jgi:hypothetical protein
LLSGIDTEKFLNQWGNDESPFLSNSPAYLDVSIIKSKSVSTKPPKSDQSYGDAGYGGL